MKPDHDARRPQPRSKVGGGSTPLDDAVYSFGVRASKDSGKIKPLTSLIRLDDFPV